MLKRSASITIQYDNVFSPFKSAKWQEGLQWVKNCGLEGVELIFSDPNLLDADALKRMLGHLGLVPSTLATGQAAVLEGLAMTSPSEHVRQITRKRLFDDIDFSVRLGRPNVTIGLIRGKGGQLPYEKEYELLKYELSNVADYANKQGVVLNLEPINRYEVRLLNTSESAYDIIMEIGNPKNVGVLYDTFHSNIEDMDILDAIRRIANKISHVHLADSNRRLPGEGHIDFSSIIATLERSGYDGFISLESLSIPSEEHVVNHAKSCLENIFKEVKQ